MCIALVLSVVLLSGCITVQEGGNTANPTKAAVAYTALAVEHVKQNNLDAAKIKAEKALQVNSNYAPAYNIMALILQRDGSAINVKKAERFFKKAIRKQKDFAQAHNNYGVYLSQLKRYDEAMKQFEIASSTLGYRSRVAAFENLGKTALKLNQVKRAENAFTQALSINSNSVVSKIELVDILIDKKLYKQAQPLYQEYINYLGNRPQSSRSLLQGILIASFAQDSTDYVRLSSLLRDNYPNSREANLFRKLFPSE